VTVYPHKFHTTISIPEFVTKYSSVEDGARVESVTVSVAGRVYRQAQQVRDEE